MKKIFSFTILALLVLVLSGCDLIPTEVLEQATEELCRENPEHELCQIENLEDIEDAIFLDFINGVFENHLDMENTEFCDNLFSVTNPELLDACRADRSSLFPDGFGNFDTASIVDDDGEFIVKVELAGNDEIIEFRIGIVVIDNTNFINEWEYEIGYIEHEGVRESELISAIELFIADFSNPDIADEDFCAIWYDGVDEDCDGEIEDSRSKFKAGADLSKTVNILDDDSDDDGLIEATVEFELDGHVTVLKLAFTVTNEGEEVAIKATGLGLVLRGIEKADIKRGIELFIDDIENLDITDEQLCAIWYDGEDNDCDGIAKARDGFKAGADLAKKVNILDEDDDDDGLFEATVEFDANGHVTVLKIMFTASDETGELVLTIKGLDLGDERGIYISAAEALEVFKLFVEDYLNPMVTGEELNDMYFDNEMDENFFSERLIDLELGIDIVVVTMDMPMMTEDGYFIIELDITKEGMTERLEVVIKPIRLDLARVDLNFKDGPGDDMDYLNIEEAEALFNAFLTDYLDPDSDDDTLLDMYFGGMMDPMFFSQRKLDIENGVMITLVEIVPIELEEPAFEITLEFNQDGMITREKIKTIVKRIDQATPMLMIISDDGNDDFFNMSEVEEIFSSLLVDYLDPTINDETLNTMYFGGMMEPEFFTQRQVDITNGVVLRFKDIMPSMILRNSFFNVHIEVEEDGMITNEMLLVRVDRKSGAVIIQSLDMGMDSVQHPYQLVVSVLDDYVARYNGLSMDSNSMCTMTVVPEMQESCVFERDEMISMGYSLLGYELTEEEFGYTVVFIFGDPDFTITKSYMVDLVPTMDNMYLLKLHEIHMPMASYEEIVAFIDELVTMLNDPRVTEEEVCSTLFGENAQEGCSALFAIREGGKTIGAGTVEEIEGLYLVEIIYVNDMGEEVVSVFTFGFDYGTAVLTVNICHL